MNVVFGGIGHWLTKEGPSIAEVRDWNNPCQCYHDDQQSARAQQGCTYDRSACPHRRVGESIVSRNNNMVVRVDLDERRGELTISYNST